MDGKSVDYLSPRDETLPLDRLSNTEFLYRGMNNHASEPRAATV
jgi:hypothetical protein